eukprot:2824903-Rhodomonas_salina.1
MPCPRPSPSGSRPTVRPATPAPTSILSRADHHDDASPMINPLTQAPFSVSFSQASSWAAGSSRLARPAEPESASGAPASSWSSTTAPPLPLPPKGPWHCEAVEAGMPGVKEARPMTLIPAAGYTPHGKLAAGHVRPRS